jgi:hypothetical protein
MIKYYIYFSILLQLLTLTFEITVFNATLFDSFHSSTCFDLTGPSSGTIAIVAKLKQNYNETALATIAMVPDDGSVRSKHVLE